MTDPTELPADQRDWGDPDEHGHMADYATDPEDEPETVPYEPPATS